MKICFIKSSDYIFLSLNRVGAIKWETEEENDALTIAIRKLKRVRERNLVFCTHPFAGSSCIFLTRNFPSRKLRDIVTTLSVFGKGLRDISTHEDAVGRGEGSEKSSNLFSTQNTIFPFVFSHTLSFNGNCKSTVRKYLK